MPDDPTVPQPRPEASDSNPEPEPKLDDHEPSSTESTATFRAVGEMLGGWARRVGALAAGATGRPVVPERLRAPLAEARALRYSGDREGALARLRALARSAPEDPFVALELGLTHLHDLLDGGRPLRALLELRDAVELAFGPGVARLLAAGPVLGEGDAGRALDHLRRALPELRRLPAHPQAEAEWLGHVMAGLAQLRLGNEERALRELRKARVRTPAEAGPRLRRLIFRHGVELALVAGQLTDAESWAREALQASPEDEHLCATLCRVMAAKGDSIAAHALLERLNPSEHARTLIWVGLTVGLPAEAPPLRDVTLRWIQTNPDDPEGLRLWALTLLATAENDHLSAKDTRDVLEALVDAAARAPAAARDRALTELAHAALRLDAIENTASEPILARLASHRANPPPEELRLLGARARLIDRGSAGPDVLETVPPVFRADPELGGPWGPDPQSPVRNRGQRGSVLASERLLVAAEVCLRDESLRDLAPDLLVEALVARPSHRRARRLLSEATLLLPNQGQPRLEDLLSTSTQLLASVPGRILGVSLEGVGLALAEVVAARERLARPLTIATMGEFSAGKSTFVNALVGEAIAPMGVLPTTTTINVFRRGTGGGARVHYRDGRIGLVAQDNVATFLHGLNDEDAQRIRHVELERKGVHMGDAAVVDTPGLNALDGYHERVAREFLDEADAVVWVFSATRSGAASEVEMLRELKQSGRYVLGVLNKVDTLEAPEIEELTQYLRDQLGDVLVEVVPLRGNDALEYRTQGGVGPDPFGPIEAALDTHFLRKARELKRSLTARRLAEALQRARQAATEAVGRLEAGADAAASAAAQNRPHAPTLLFEFGEALEPRVTGAADVLVREGLGMGVLQTKKGLAKGPLDTLDAQYLGACLRDSVLGALQHALMEVAARDPAASQVLDQRFLPWARGYLDGMVEAGSIARMFALHGPKIADGEAAARSGFKTALRPAAEAWSAHARSFVADVERARHDFDQTAASKPRAEALRLQTALVCTLQELLETARRFVDGH